MSSPLETYDVIIYKQPKSAMQSGLRANWFLEFKPDSGAKFVYQLNGWIGSKTTSNQVSLSFKTKEEAVSYAKESGLRYFIMQDSARRLRKKSYADNFK